MNVKDKALDQLRYRKKKLERTKMRDERIRNNKMFVEDQAIFYRRTQAEKKKIGKVPNMEKF